MSKTIELLRFNWKTLLFFEIIYRLFGLAVIFPVANRLLYISVKLSGHEYLVNSNFTEYISRPSTILIFISMFLIFGLYIAYEIVVLAILFHSSYYKQIIGLYTLFVASIQKLFKLIRRYHIFIILSSMLFFAIVEGLHIVGIATTIQIPTVIEDQLSSTKWFYPTLLLSIFIAMYLFIETIFFELQCTIEESDIYSNFSHSRKILKGNRINYFIEFISINVIINTFFYLVYFMIIGLVGLLLFLIKDDNVVYPTLLTILYTIYLVIGFVATIVLIPANFAWINSLYYQNKKSVDKKTQIELNQIMTNRSYSKRFYDRLFATFGLILTMIVVFVLTSVSNDPSHLELFNNPIVIVHRGGGNSAPENTISAIEMGIDLGADSVEFDVRFTKDNIPILMHDETLGRTTNDTLNRAVNALTLEEIKQLDAGSWFSEEFIGEEVPTLREAIEVIDSRIDIFLEIKGINDDAVSIILDIIEETSIENKVKIMSFNETLLKDIKDENRNIETILLLPSFVGDINILSNKEHIDHYGLRYTIINNNKEQVRRLQESGKGVFVWTVNEETSILEMIQLNVDGIITDAPLLTRELVYSDSKKSQFTKLLEQLFTRE